MARWWAMQAQPSPQSLGVGQAIDMQQRQDEHFLCQILGRFPLPQPGIGNRPYGPEIEFNQPRKRRPVSRRARATSDSLVDSVSGVFMALSVPFSSIAVIHLFRRRFHPAIRA